MRIAPASRRPNEPALGRTHEEHRLGGRGEEPRSIGLLKHIEHLTWRDGEPPGEAVPFGKCTQLRGVLARIDVERDHLHIATEACEGVSDNQLLPKAARSPDGHPFDDRDLPPVIGEGELLTRPDIGQGRAHERGERCGGRR